MTEPTGPLTKRRIWPRISLRTLLIVVGIAGIGLGLVGNFWRNLQRKRHAIALVEAAGGDIHYSYQFGYEDDEFASPRRHFRSVSHREVEGRRERTTKSSLGTTVEYETPPGPKLLRRFFGDNAFADVDAISFDSVQFPAELAPQILGRFPELKVVRLNQSQMQAKWLKECATVPKLRALSLSSKEASITGADFAHLISARGLKTLDCFGGWIRDDTVAGLASLRQLEAVQIANAPQLTSASFEHLSQLPELRSLTVIRANNVDDAGGEPLAKLQKLHTLWLMYTAVGDRTMQSLSELSELEVLLLSGTNVGDAGAAQIGKLTKLKQLALDRTNVTDTGVHALASLKHLQILTLDETRITDASLATIAQLTELESLHLTRCPEISGNWQQLHGLKHLRLLYVGPHITPEQLRDLKQALPDCDIGAFDARGSGITPAQNE